MNIFKDNNKKQGLFNDKFKKYGFYLFKIILSIFLYKFKINSIKNLLIKKFNLN